MQLNLWAQTVAADLWIQAAAVPRESAIVAPAMSRP